MPKSKHRHSSSVPCTEPCPVAVWDKALAEGKCPECGLPQENFGCSEGRFGWYCKFSYRGRGA